MSLTDEQLLYICVLKAAKVQRELQEGFVSREYLFHALDEIKHIGLGSEFVQANWRRYPEIKEV